MAKQSGVANQLLEHLQVNREVVSLLALTDSLGIAYRYAHQQIGRLEAEKVIRVNRTPGKPMVISINTEINGFAIPTDCSDEPISKHEPHQERKTGNHMPYVISDELEKGLKVAAGSISMMNFAGRVQQILEICRDNARLLMEVNEFRQAAGLEPYPVYDPMKTARAAAAQRHHK